MSREIKFRAWNKKNKNMMYDSDLDYIGKPLISLQGVLCGAWTSEGGGGVEPLIEGFDNFILMQYTGLKDKNGNEIYDGDIVKSPMSHSLEIFWMGLAWGVRWTDLGNDEESIICDDGGDMAMDEKGLKYMEIIGNIYSNPELLEPPLGNGAEPIRNISEDDWRKDDR